MLLKKIIDYGRMIKFSHSVFALPFALSGALLAGVEATLTWGKLFWIIIAMVSARSAAMGFNRLVDNKIDATNPRTKERHLPSGKISASETSLFIVVFSIVFIFAAWKLNMLCFYLSPLALFVILFYSYTKRFTSFSHYVLGLGLGLSPIGAWLAITGYFALEPIILSLAVMFWVSGFDIIYACQDVNFDKENKLHSIPKLLGLKNALLLARFSHLLAFSLLAWVGFLVPLHFIYSAGLVIIAGVLTYEHTLVKEDNLLQVSKAFFNMNGIISIVFFILMRHVLLISFKRGSSVTEIPYP